MSSEYRDSLLRFSALVYASGQQLKSKPLMGGHFGTNAFVIATYPSTLSGLDAVSYNVIHDESRAIIATGYTATETLQKARRYLTDHPESVVYLIASMRDWHGACANYQQQKREEQQAEREAARAARETTIPKRRQQIFDKSDGKCHYCGVALAIRGDWHIEHMTPRALLGGDKPANLVASCIPCNMKKKDQTADEFMATGVGS